MNFKDVAKRPLGRVFMGGYRLSQRSNKHRVAFKKALELGLTAVDTSANYTDGESERLIGELAPEDLFVITKAGYIQGQNLKVLEDLHGEGKAKKDLVEINETLKHSIHPEFLESQIDLSLKHLRRDNIDCFLLHNPEYFFKVSEDREEYYSRLQKAFEYLEEQVQKGRISCYGVSSNTFVSKADSKDYTDLSRVYQAAQKANSNPHFAAVQFPMNLLELGALEKAHPASPSFLEVAHELQLTTLANRPLNAFSSEGRLVRLALYEQADQFDTKKAQEQWDKVYEIMEAQYNAQAQEQENAPEFEKMPIIKQVKEIWMTLPSPDAVDQVFQGHLFPFVAQLWEGNLTPEQSAPFYELYDYAQEASRLQMNLRARSFQKQAQDSGLLPPEEHKQLAQQAVDFILDKNIDHVLLGMKDANYVNQFADWLK
jgi:aryl-alcohol dehydrogenase-like predicted oxidoreductase